MLPRMNIGIACPQTCRPRRSPGPRRYEINEATDLKTKTNEGNGSHGGRFSNSTRARFARPGGRDLAEHTSTCIGTVLACSARPRPPSSRPTAGAASNSEAVECGIRCLRWLSSASPFVRSVSPPSLRLPRFPVSPSCLSGVSRPPSSDDSARAPVTGHFASGSYDGWRRRVVRGADAAGAAWPERGGAGSCRGCTPAPRDGPTPDATGSAARPSP